MNLQVNLQEDSYPVYIQRGILNSISSLIPPHEKIAIITDTGVPQQWIDTAAGQFENPLVLVFEQGEANKNVKTWTWILEQLAAANFHRSDAIIALGGGVAGDMAGFAAACYMRGIAFYNVPTTVLSQVDSSVGGKTAIDLAGYKNIVGAFYQPKAVFIDPDVLSTLSDRHISNGLVEALKMGLILDESLVAAFEQEELDTDAIIARSIDLKRQIVEEDEKEAGLRAVLNFGHTIGHAIESACSLQERLHGECVAWGMLFFINDEETKKRTAAILEKLSIPPLPDVDADTILAYLKNDKKSQAASVKTVQVDTPGVFCFEPQSFEEIRKRLERGL